MGKGVLIETQNFFFLNSGSQVVYIFGNKTGNFSLIKTGLSRRGTGVVESFLRGPGCHKHQRGFQVRMETKSKATHVDR